MNDPSSFPVDRTENELIKKIDKAVKLRRHDPKWRQQYMSYIQEKLTAEYIGEQRGIEIGERRGIEIGERRGIEIGERRGIEIGERRGIEIGERRGIGLGERLGLEKGRLSAAINAIRILRITDPSSVAALCQISEERAKELIQQYSQQ